MQGVEEGYQQRDRTPRQPQRMATHAVRKGAARAVFLRRQMAIEVAAAGEQPVQGYVEVDG